MRKREDEKFLARRQAKLAKAKAEMDTRNEARRDRDTLPLCARSLSPGQKVHIVSTVLRGKVRCRKDIRGSTSDPAVRSVHEEQVVHIHPKIYSRKVCKLCAMVHEPEPGVLWSGDPSVHLIARAPPGTPGPWGFRGDGRETVCGQGLDDVRWSEKPHVLLGMCPRCTTTLWPGKVVSKEDELVQKVDGTLVQKVVQKRTGLRTIADVNREDRERRKRTTRGGESVVGTDVIRPRGP